MRVQVSISHRIPASSRRQSGYTWDEVRAIPTPDDEPSGPSTSPRSAGGASAGNKRQLAEQRERELAEQHQARLRGRGPRPVDSAASSDADSVDRVTLPGEAAARISSPRRGGRVGGGRGGGGRGGGGRGAGAEGGRGGIRRGGGAADGEGGVNSVSERM